MAKTDYQSIEEYIAAQPEAVRPVLERVRGIIRKVLPEAEEGISYQIPTFKVDGQYVVYLSAAKQHFGLYPVTDGIREALGPEVEPHLAGKGTMRFAWSEPVPVKLIERVVKVLAKAAAERAKAKTGSKVTRRR